MKYVATSGAFVFAFALLFVAGTANGQSFEGQGMGNWYGNATDYDTNAEISDSVAYDGSYSVRASVGSDGNEGAFANDDVEVAPGDSLIYRVWIAEGQLSQINGIMPFVQWHSPDAEWAGQIFPWNDAGNMPTGEWFVLSTLVPEEPDPEYESTARIGLQINAVSDSATPTIYVDEITHIKADSSDEEYLPVELAGFNAVQDGNDVTLQWQTASETNNAGFEVEQRRKGDSWTQVGFVEGSGTSGQAQSYSHSLTDLTPGQYAFRLRQVDYDGSAAYSSEVTVQIRSEGAFELSSPAPNPFEEQAQFTVTASEQQEVRVEVFNTLGQRVAELHDGSLGAGEVRSFSLESSDLPSGVYFVRGKSASHTVTHRIVLVQ